jgi:hypothetical protein
MMSIADKFCNNDEVTNMGKFDEGSFASPIMFSAFDNMVGRKAMFAAWKEQEDRKIFIDGRMLAESAQIFSVVPGQEEEYEKQLFEDSEVEDQACSMKATSHCGAMTAGYMTAVFNNYIANQELDMHLREVPFKTTFELPTITQSVIV